MIYEEKQIIPGNMLAICNGVCPSTVTECNDAFY